MGAVYRVHSALTQRLEAALKVMKPTLDEDARRRFVREAEALSALRHPAIVRVMGFSEDPTRGLLYLVMELAIGETLKDRLARGAMTLPEALRTFVPLASALDHAHDAGIFHRDLKPANVVLCDDGTPRLVDFGIAGGTAGQTLTDTGQMGTLSYLPPEVFRGQTADPRGIDVYGFGLLLYEALIGTRVFAVDPGVTAAVAAASVGARKLQQKRLELPETFPPTLRDGVAAATDPDPSARPSMHEFRATLQSLVDRRGAPVAAPPSRKLPPPAPAPPVPRAAAPHADRTMRVPDPPQPDISDRIVAASKGRGMLIGGGVLALLVAVGLSFALSRGNEGPKSGGRQTETRKSSGDQRAAPRTDDGTVGQDAPEPGGPSGAARSPVAASATPPPSPSPAPSPSATPRPSPSVRPSPAATPAPPTETTSPSETTPPAPAVVHPEVEEAAPADGRDDGPAAVPVTNDLSGEWDLSNRVVSTDYDGFRGLNLGYRLTLRQSGSRITGSGVKVSENGAPSNHTPITVSGRIDGSNVVLTFTEQGAVRSSGGTFRWQLSSDGSRLRGSFWSDAANTNGPSSARRIQ